MQCVRGVGHLSLLQHQPERVQQAQLALGVRSLSLAHERTCEAQLADLLAQDLSERRLPDLKALRARFTPDPALLSQVCVQLASLSDYEALVNLDMGVQGRIQT